LIKDTTVEISGLNNANASPDVAKQVPQPAIEKPAQTQQQAQASNPPADTVQLSQAANDLYRQSQQQTQVQKASSAAAPRQQPPGSVLDTVA
jgi:hypothetical protein